MNTPSAERAGTLRDSRLSPTLCCSNGSNIAVLRQEQHAGDGLVCDGLQRQLGDLLDRALLVDLCQGRVDLVLSED